MSKPSFLANGTASMDVYAGETVANAPFLFLTIVFAYISKEAEIG